MRRRSLALLMILTGSLVAGCFGDDGTSDGATGPCEDHEADPPTGNSTQPVPPLDLELVAEGSPRLVHALPHEGGLLLVQQEGWIDHWTPPDGSRRWLDLTDRVGSGSSEQGLLGLAMGDGGRYYVDYTDQSGATVLSRLREPPVDGETWTNAEQVLLRVEQPFANHNGGHIAFGPDGYLYVALGDGGAAADPGGNGQNKLTLLGSILRLDVSGTDAGYTIPPDNPCVDDPLGADETWVYGVRNPWRFSFDRETGDLWIGDVGQDRVEEITRVPAGEGGFNLGWNLFEGHEQFPTGLPADLGLPGLLFPAAVYSHGDGDCSVTGGVVYRGDAIPSLDGTYLYGDFCSGRLWGMPSEGGAPELLLETGLNIASFVEDADGEVLVIHHGGAVHRLVAAGDA